MSDASDQQAPRKTAPVWTANEAHVVANVLSLAPFLFQAVATMRDTGLMPAVLKARRKGLAVEEAAELSGMSPYGITILRDMGRSVGLFADKGDERLHASTLAHFLVHDKGIDVQFGLSQHFAWEGLPALTEGLRTQTPAGLATFGDWETIYPHLRDLPETAQDAWFAWDHHYSDLAFAEALAVVLAESPRVLLDIGGNTGRFANEYLTTHLEGVAVIQDLPKQLEVADAELAAVHPGRYRLHACDVLQEQPFYEDADCAWMSQFVCCFSPSQLVTIFRKTAAALPLGAPIFVLDTFCDRQSEPSSAYALHAASLYFANFANGRGRMHAAVDVLAAAEEAGLALVGDHPIGRYHSLLVLRGS